MAGKDITLYESSTSTHLFPRTYTRNVFDEDGTTTLQTLLANIVNEAGKIAEVKVNGTALTITNKSVNIDLSGYQAKGTIDITNTTPGSATKYYPIYSTGTGTGQTARANSDLYYYDSGTWASFNIGFMGNKGILTLHNGTSSTDRYVDISAATLTANRTLTIPDKSGTIALTDDLGNYAPASHTQSITTITNSAGNTITSTKVSGSRSHSGWTNNANDDRIIPTMSFIAYWDGSYNVNGSSNLVNCANGQIVGTTGTQTISGVKTFSNGIKIGDANFTYDSSTKSVKVTFS